MMNFGQFALGKFTIIIILLLAKFSYPLLVGAVKNLYSSFLQLLP